MYVRGETPGEIDRRSMSMHGEKSRKVKPGKNKYERSTTCTRKYQQT